jgi:hypothetical protein
MSKEEKEKIKQEQFAGSSKRANLATKANISPRKLKKVLRR